MDLMIERLRGRIRDHDDDTVQVRARDGFRYEKPDLGLIEWMPTHEVAGPVVVKMVGIPPDQPVSTVPPQRDRHVLDVGHRDRPSRGPGRCDAADRGPDGSGIGDRHRPARPVRPGHRRLGRPGGPGGHPAPCDQRVRPVTRVIALDTAVEVAETFARRTAFLGLDVEVVDPARSATVVGEVDVLCTCTSVDIGAGPVIEDVDHHPWLHVNAIGADFPGKLELPSSLVSRAPGGSGHPRTVHRRGGVSAAGPGSHRPDDHRAGPTTPADAAKCRDELTVFDSTGWAVEDDVAPCDSRWSSPTVTASGPTSSWSISRSIRTTPTGGALVTTGDGRPGRARPARQHPPVSPRTTRAPVDR